MWPTTHAEQTKKTKKTKQERLCFARELPKVMQNDIVVTMMPIMQPFVFRVFAVSCVHVVANKTCTYTKSGKTRQRLLFFANGLHSVVHDAIVLTLTPLFIPVLCSIFLSGWGICKQSFTSDQPVKSWGVVRHQRRHPRSYPRMIFQKNCS